MENHISNTPEIKAQLNRQGKGAPLISLIFFFLKRKKIIYSIHYKYRKEDRSLHKSEWKFSFHRKVDFEVLAKKPIYFPISMAKNEFTKEISVRSLYVSNAINHLLGYE